MDMRPDDAWSEDLLWQAQRGMELGRAFCTCDGDYHSVWGTLRAAGVMSSLTSEEPVLARIIAPFVADGARVMIGGAADPGLFCVIGRIYGRHSPAITVIDRCKAPLALIEEFAAQKRLACATHNLDLLDLEGRETWDHIFLHYTPDFVDERSRGRFFERIAASLAVNGTLFCVSMTGSRVSGERRHDLETSLVEFSWTALRHSPLLVDQRESELKQMIEAYAAASSARRLAYPTIGELRELLRHAGLRIVGEHATPRRQRLFETGARSGPDTSTLIIAQRA